MPRDVEHRALPTAHIRDQALRALAAYRAGRIDAATAQVVIDLARVEAAEILKRNLAVARGEAPPPPLKFSPPPGRPRGFRRPGQRVPYWLTPKEERRPYTFRDASYWAQRSPKLARMLNAEDQMLEMLQCNEREDGDGDAS